jgi:hypothetical protein
MVEPGNWYIELDDGSGADLHTEIDGTVRLEIGDVLPGRIYGRKWRIKRVEPDRKYARSVPHP